MLVCEWDLSTIEMALIPSCVLFFYAIGSIMSGKLADKFGRWPNLLAAYYLICISGTASAVATSYIMFIICRSLTGYYVTFILLIWPFYIRIMCKLLVIGPTTTMLILLPRFRYWSKLWSISGLCPRVCS